MGSWKAIFIVALIHALCSWHHAHADIEPINYRSSGGGGSCDTDLDCNLKGRCMNEDASVEKETGAIEGDDDGIGQCVCKTGRDGRHCESEDERPSRRDVIYGLRRNKQRLEKRQLKSDPELEATGLNPEEVATNEQSFVIFNPRTNRYVRVSTDSPPTGDEGTKYLITDQGYKGANKLFRLVRAERDSPKYFILARDDDDTNTVGYVYLSTITNRIMMSATEGTGDEYRFSFVRHHGQHGVYKIKCQEMTLYGSVGGHNVKADQRTGREMSEEIWFQINLKADSKITTKVTNTNRDALLRDDDFEVEHEEYDNGNNENEQVTLNKETKQSKVLTKFGKIFPTESGNSKDTFRHLGFYVSKARSTNVLVDNIGIGKTNIRLTVITRSKACVEYTFRVRSSFDEDRLVITYNDNTYTGYKLRENRRVKTGDVTLAVKKVDLDAECQ